MDRIVKIEKYKYRKTFRYKLKYESGKLVSNQRETDIPEEASELKEQCDKEFERTMNKKKQTEDSISEENDEENLRIVEARFSENKEIFKLERKDKKKPKYYYYSIEELKMKYPNLLYNYFYENILYTK